MKTNYPKIIQTFMLRRASMFLILVASAVWCLSAAADTHIWNGNVSSNWGTGANWDNGKAPSDGDQLVFPPGATRLTTINNISSLSVSTIRITGVDYVLRGNWITIEDSIEASYSSGRSQLEMDIDVDSSATFICQQNGLHLDFTGNIVVGSSLTVEGEGNVHLMGVVEGNGGLTMNGTGRLRLEGSTLNSYHGNTVVNSGWLALAKTATPAVRFGELIIGDGISGVGADTVIANRDFQIGDIPITINSSGVLHLEGHNDRVGPIEFNGGTIYTKAEFTMGTLTLGGDITVNPVPGASIHGQIQLPANRLFTIAPAPGSPELDLRAVVTGQGGFTVEGGGSLALSGTNTFEGHVTIRDGLVYVDNPFALGDTAAGTTVQDVGVLAIRGNVHLGQEPLTLSGSGNGAHGALSAPTGVNSAAGPIELSADAVISVGGGHHLDLTGRVSGSGGFIKRGNGTLRLSGSSANTFTGNAVVEDGALEMNKSNSNGAVPGTLWVGTESGLPGNAIARNLRDQQCRKVVVDHSGLYDLNDLDETVTDLTLRYAAAVETGSGLLTLSSGSTLSVLQNPLVLAGTVATISGNLDVGSNVRHFQVAHGMPPLLNPVDLKIDAVVSGSAIIIKEGSGVLGLAQGNTFTGRFSILEGTVRITHPGAFGTTASGTFVYPGAKLTLVGGTVVGDEPLTLGEEYGSQPATLTASGGTAAWGGDITLEDDALIRVAGASDRLYLEGAISSGGGLAKTGLTKTGPGLLFFSGSSKNTYSGPTEVNEGTLVLDKSVGNLAIPAELVIGDGSGGDGADVVRLLQSSQIEDIRVTIAASGRFDLNNHSEAIGSLSGSGRVSLGTATLSVGADNTSTSYDGLIDEYGQLRKYGSGTFTLTADNTYAGRTEVHSGTLLVNGSQLHSEVQVHTSGHLGGRGSVGDLNCDGTVAPGVSPGALTADDVVLDAGSTLAIELEGTSAGSSYDQLRVLGSVDLNNAYLDLSVGDSLSQGDEFVIINNYGTDPVTGQFQSLPDDATIERNGFLLRVDYQGGSGNDVVLSVAATALELASTQVTTGNGDGLVDPNECNLLHIVLTNNMSITINGIQAQLSSSSPGVLVHQAVSDYPNIPVRGEAANLIPFQVSTLPSMVPGADLEFELRVSTANAGTFIVQLTIPTGSTLGDGPCLPCPNQVYEGTITGDDLLVRQLLVQDGTASRCRLPKPCPGIRPALVDCHYDTYFFQNGASQACVTVRLESVGGLGQLYSAAYATEFDPSNPCARYLADAGQIGNAEYSFDVAPGEIFVVTVTDAQKSTVEVPYRLTVSGGSCEVWLDIDRADSDQVAISWPTMAPAYRLQSSLSLDPSSAWGPRGPAPIVHNGQYTVTNLTSPAPNRFYRLHKP